MQTVFLDGQPQTYDSLLRFGAREIWISSMLVPLRDESGVVTAVMGISRDITERKQAEEILTESEERYRSLFKNMLNGFAYCKMIFEKGLPQDFIYLEVNDAFSALTGLKEVEGKKVTEVIPGIRESDPVLFETYGRVALSGKPETLEIYVEAMNMWFSIAVYSPRKEYFVAVFDIITARKQAEQALRESEERFHSLYENSSIGIYRATPDGHITLANPALVRMLGYQTFEEISQRDLRTDGYEPEYSRLEFQQRIAREGGVNGLESALKLKDGSTIFVRENAHLVLDERDQPLFYEGTVEDITKRKRAEEEIRKLNATLEQRVEERTNELREAQEELVRKEKLATLGQLAGSVGHELRNPLGVINTSIYYLKMVQPDANQKIKKHLEMIENQVHLSDKIITDLLDFSRGATAEREQISVPSLLEKTLERFPVPAGVELRLDLPQDLPDVFADLRQMEQVLGNLVTNGCQAMKNAGRLTISAHAVVPVSAAGPESSTGREQQKEMVAIAVNDTGTGIAPENMQKLFEPLFTTKARGVGLGLAVSKKLAEANGGRIEVESEVGKGSTFTLYLPVPWSL